MTAQTLWVARATLSGELPINPGHFLAHHALHADHPWRMVVRIQRT
jgi:hypothetical protein